MNDSRKKQETYDEIFAQLDALMQNRQNETADALQEKVNRRYDSGPILADIQTNTHNTHIVKRPSLPSTASQTFEGRYDCFSKLIQGVDYGTYNASEYVEGHQEALKKYYAQAQSSSNDLSIVEGRINDEITKYNHVTKNNLFVKGYYDGLLYVYRALKKSKEVAVGQIQKILRRGLKL